MPTIASRSRPPVRTEDYFEAIVETVRQPLVVLERNLTVRSANRAFYEIFGSDIAEGRNLFEVGNGRWDTPDLRHLLLEVHGDQVDVVDHLVHHEFADLGPRAMVLNARRLDTGDSDLILLAIEDVTEQERVQDALEERVAERTAELEAFSYSVSHDLRAPLRAIDGFSRILLEDYGDALPEGALRYLGLIRTGAGDMGELIEGLLAFSRAGRQDLARVPVGMDVLVAEAIDKLRVRPEAERAEIVVGDLPEALVGPTLIRQVFVNLIENALKFSAKGPHPRVEIGAREIDGETVFFVADNGVGFDQQYADQIFGVFRRLNLAEDYEGTGIGLAIAERIVVRHGGRIWVEAAPGDGATFFFSLGGDTA
jgi:PAS domain S-box-containing protein